MRRAFAAFVVAGSLLAAIASGKDEKKKETRYDPANKTALSKQMAAIVEGNAKYNERDFPAAREAYKKAVSIAPTDPLTHYMVAELELSQGNIPDGEAALQAAEKVGNARPDIMGRVLFLEADAKERQKKWADAKAGWQRYSEWAATHADAGAVPQSAAARIQAIDDYIKLDQQYEEVRKRIAEEKADGGKINGKIDGGK